MNLNPISPKEYAKEIPMEIRQIVRTMGDEDRLGILIALLRHGRMTFSELKNLFSMNPSSLQNHLSKLLQVSLIDNYYERGEGKSYSYYEATEIPEKVFHSLYDAVLAEAEFKLPSAEESIQSAVESQRRELREIENLTLYASRYGRGKAARIRPKASTTAAAAIATTRFTTAAT